MAKLLGKRQIAQLEFVDYIIGISIGSIAAEMATDINDKPLYYYLIARVIYFLFDIIINWIGNKEPCLKHFFKGKPLTQLIKQKDGYITITNFGEKIYCKKVIIATGFNWELIHKEDLCERFVSYSIVTAPLKDFS